MATPTDFHPQLTNARLRKIAETLLDVLYDTELELAGELDDAYTRGTATFGRQRNAVIQLCQSGQYDWLKLTNAGMDVTFEISGVPCRFFADDPSNPKKPGFFRRNDSDKLFEFEQGKPEMFRFVVAKAETGQEENDVFFIGFDGNGEEVYRWSFSNSTPTLSSVDHRLPTEVPIPPARVSLRVVGKETGKDAKSGTDNNAQQP